MKIFKMKNWMLLFTSFSLLGQTFQIKKIVVDKTTNLPIRNISIFNDQDNSITNNDGVFVFVSNKDEINFEGTGYNDFKTTFELLKISDTVFLARKAILLDEVVLNDAGALMKKVYSNLNNNFAVEPYGENFFLRCLLKKNEAITRFQDIAGKVFRKRLFRTKENSDSEYAVEVLNMRKAGISETQDIEYFQFQSFKNTFDVCSSILLNAEDKFSFAEMSSLDPDYRKVNFIEKEKNDRGQNTNGYFLINKSNYSIKEVFIDRYTDKNSVPYYEKGNYKWRTTSFQSLVQYAKNTQNNKYYINNAIIKGNVEFLKDNSIRTIYDFVCDLFVTNSFVDEKVKSNFSVDKDIFKAKFSYSEQFWNNQNQLLLTNELKKFLERISENKNNKELEIIGNFK